MTPAQIEERFFNFPRETLDLIARYHETQDSALVTPVFHGILRKYAPEGAGPDDSGSAVVPNAFGLESLTLMEVILDLQDALDIRLADDELRQLRSLEETNQLLTAKVAALRAAPPTSGE